MAEPPAAIPKGGRWERDGDADVLRIECANPRLALTPGLLAATAVTALLGVSVAAIAGASLLGVLSAAVLIVGTVLPLIYFMRLSLVSRELVLRFTAGALEVREGDGDSQGYGAASAVARSVRLADISRIVFVHDGAPARILLESRGARRERWVIGDLYRHNRVERFVPEPPTTVTSWLGDAGVVPAITVRRGIRTSSFRR